MGAYPDDTRYIQEQSPAAILSGGKLREPRDAGGHPRGNLFGVQVSLIGLSGA
jgi:hypothetical protein